MRGSGNGRFKNGKSYAKLFREMRVFVLERDGVRCRVCAAEEKKVTVTRITKQGTVVGQKSNLTAHHIDEDPRNNDPANLITLCQSCHMKHHKSHVSPFLELSEMAISANQSMTSKWRAATTSLLMAYSSTTV